MRILKDNQKRGEVLVKVTTLDDLWYLSQVLDKHDFVTGDTVRKIKLGNGEEGKTQIIKKHARITVEVEKVEFHKYTNALRINGKIKEGPEDVQRGAFHTINVEENDTLLIVKEHWHKYQRDKLKEACKEKLPKILICVLERKEVSFALLKRYGYEYISDFEGEVQEKAFPNIKKDATFYADIVKRLQEYDQRYKLDKLIVASPAFWKEEFNKEVVKRAPDLKKKILYTVCHTTGKSAMHEVLKSDEIKKALKDERIIEEIQLVQEVFKEIAKNGNAVYGMREVQEAADIGAIKILLVTDELIQQLRQSESYEPLDNIMKTVEAAGGEIHIITAEHQAGQELQGITGIAAITRYKIKE
ncbi:mRNA surveillance protein pelota [Candidatus Woesearchaeota archaeon]|nr:mRNA surveillance protein pelota [Candidatus Woesearchaeota archaeon]